MARRTSSASHPAAIVRIVRRARSFIVLSLLTLALLVIELVTGCDTSPSQEEPSVYYGPPPADMMQDDASTSTDVAVSVDVVSDVPTTTDTGPVVYYGPAPIDAVDDVPTATDLGPVVYYGPQPVDAIGDVPTATDTGPVVYYGPQPVDAIDDVPTATDAGPVVYYGPQPVDAVSDVPTATDGGMVVLYGPAYIDVTDDIGAEDIKDDCPPMAFYGPPPCTSDEECVQWYGQDWYCNPDNTFSDGCGGVIHWPACEQKP